MKNRMNEHNLPLPLGGGINGVKLLARIFIYIYLQGDFNRRKTGSVPTKHFVTRLILNLSKWCKNIKCVKFYILSFHFSKHLHINNYLRQNFCLNMDVGTIPVYTRFESHLGHFLRTYIIYAQVLLTIQNPKLT